MAILAGAVLAITACGSATPEPPVKRQPGSWGQKIRIVRFEGKDVDARAKEGMQRMFDMMSGMTMCVTPELAAREDTGKSLEQLGGQGRDCTIEKREISGETVNFAAVCKRGAKTVRMTGKGTSGATAQDLTMMVESIDAAGKAEGVMEMRVIADRRGDCTAKDVRAPAPAAVPGGQGRP